MIVAVGVRVPSYQVLEPIVIQQYIQFTVRIIMIHPCTDLLITSVLHMKKSPLLLLLLLPLALFSSPGFHGVERDSDTMKSSFLFYFNQIDVELLGGVFDND